MKQQSGYQNIFYIAVFLNRKLSTEKRQFKFEAINTVNYQTARAWRIKKNFRNPHFNQPKENAFILFCRWSEAAKNCKINAIFNCLKVFVNKKFIRELATKKLKLYIFIITVR